MIKKNQKRQKNTFFIDEKEIFLRSWWFAHKVVSATSKVYYIITGKFLIKDMLNKEIEKRIFFETIGYTVSFVLDKLRDDIEEKEGWTDETWELNITYQICLSKAFDLIFDLKSKRYKESVFYEILDAYHDSNKYIFRENKDTDEWELFDDNSNFVVENLYAYRVNKIVKVVNRETVTTNAKQLYSRIGLSFYKKAFFDTNLEQIKIELNKISNL